MQASIQKFVDQKTHKTSIFSGIYFKIKHCFEVVKLLLNYEKRKNLVRTNMYGKITLT